MNRSILSTSGFFCALLLLTLHSIVSNAGSETGNGGHGVYCIDEKGNKSVELFDYYEGRTLRNLKKADFGIQSQNFEDHLQVAFKRIEKWNPTRAGKYRRWYSTFWDKKETALLPNVVLAIVPDYGNAVFPNGCEIKQAAIQAEPSLPGDKRYTISKDLWEIMGPTDKAGLVLHELAYREAIDLGQKSSKFVRYFNASVSDPEIESFTQRQYVELVKTVNFITFDVNRYYPCHGVNRKYPTWHTDNVASSCWMGSANVLAPLPGVYPQPIFKMLRKYGQSGYAGDGEQLFYPDGSPQNVEYYLEPGTPNAPEVLQFILRTEAGTEFQVIFRLTSPLSEPIHWIPVPGAPGTMKRFSYGRISWDQHGFNYGDGHPVPGEFEIKSDYIVGQSKALVFVTEEIGLAVSVIYSTFFSGNVKLGGQWKKAIEAKSVSMEFGQEGEIIGPIVVP